MSKINDGGPAFPLSGSADLNGNYAYPEYGMSLRDWFAGQALAGLISHYGTRPGASIDEPPRRAFIIADAMLAARQQGGDE